ncbi:MAG: family 78 glycoside hydrolase catalytic domain [Chryseolinea sp.]
MRVFLIISAMFAAACNAPQTSNLQAPSKLTCEYLSDPGVVDVVPRLAWINTATSSQRSEKQTAYQIRVATSEQKLEDPDLWDSDKVPSEESNRIVYKGKTLSSGQDCFWQVRTWDSNDKPGAWSKHGRWRMGLLNKEDWKAKWIGAPWQNESALPKPEGGPDGVPKEFGPPAPMLRKTFDVSKKIKRAIAFVTGLGYFEFYVNGNKVGDDVLIPNQTNYGKRPGIETALISLPDNFKKYKVMYLAYDITDELVQGKNAIGAILGNGFYNPAKFWTEGYGSPRFLGQIHVSYEDGSEDVITSDTTWTVRRSPIIRDMVYYGEIYDAREEQKDWSSPGYDDGQWEKAIERTAPYGGLTAHTAHTDKVMEQLKPVSIERLREGHYKVDFGKEISGWVKLLNVQGPAGHTIDMAFNGNLYSGDNRYICSGNGPATYAPRFNWFVFSGVEIRNWPGELKTSDLVAEAVNTYVEPSASFETSIPLFNQINSIWRRSQLDNMHGGIASDCPHRERSGYTGDAQVACPTVMHNFESRNFYQKWVQDMHDAQLETGYVPNGAPWQPGCGGGVAWGAAICIIPWEFYMAYGARDMLEDNYKSMKGYVRYMQSWIDKDGIMFSKVKNYKNEEVQWYNLGEWVAPGPTVADDMVHTFYYWYCADITARTALALGRQQETEQYSAIAENTKRAFHTRFYRKESGTYGDGGGNIFALKMGVPKDQHAAVVTSLRESISSKGGHLDTGIFGTRFFFEVLAENGMNDLAFEAMNKTTAPSFGHWIELGSTTSREQWDEGGSHNHPMFGGGLVWFYRNLAGMKSDEAEPGYKHIIIRPQPVSAVSHTSYTLQTPYGEAGVDWKLNDTIFEMNVTVPVGSSATVYVPTQKGQKASLANSEDSNPMNGETTEGGYTKFKVGSGQYVFQAK